jgi:hypothetical protein
VNDKDRDIIQLMVALITIGMIVVMCFLAVSVQSEASEVTEGIVVDKAYHAVTSPQPIYSPEKYMIKIITVRDGEDVKCWISCTEEEWNSYRIGDYFRR